MSPARWKRSCGRSSRAAPGWLGAKMNWMSGRRRGSNSSFWPMVAWMRWWRVRLSSVRSTCMMLSPKSLRVACAEARLAEQVATRRAQLFVECRGDARAPVALGREHDAAATAAGADVSRYRARVIFGRKRELVEPLRRRPVRRQEVEREDRRAGSQQLAGGHDFFARQRADDEFGAGRGALAPWCRRWKRRRCRRRAGAGAWRPASGSTRS